MVHGIGFIVKGIGLGCKVKVKVKGIRFRV